MAQVFQFPNRRRQSVSLITRPGHQTLKGMMRLEHSTMVAPAQCRKSAAGHKRPRDIEQCPFCPRKPKSVYLLARVGILGCCRFTGRHF